MVEHHPKKLPEARKARKPHNPYEACHEGLLGKALVNTWYNGCPYMGTCRANIWTKVESIY